MKQFIKKPFIGSIFDCTEIGKIDELASLLFGKHVLVGGMFGVSVKEGRKILNGRGLQKYFSDPLSESLPCPCSAWGAAMNCDVGCVKLKLVHCAVSVGLVRTCRNIYATEGGK